MSHPAHKIRANMLAPCGFAGPCKLCSLFHRRFIGIEKTTSNYQKDIFGLSKSSIMMCAYLLTIEFLHFSTKLRRKVTATVTALMALAKSTMSNQIDTTLVKREKVYSMNI